MRLRRLPVLLSGLAVLILGPSWAIPVHSEPLPARGFATSADSLALLDSLRVRCREDHADLEARRRLADLLAESPSIEGRREAAEALTEALLVDESDVDLWVRLARLRKVQKFRAESRRAYRRALELAPDRGELWNELAREELIRFQRFDSREYLREAEAANRRALALAPELPEVWRRQVRLAYFSGDLRELDALLEGWARVAPEDPWPGLVRGMRLVEEEQWDRAAREFERAFAGLDSLTLEEFGSIRRVNPLEDLAATESPDSSRYVSDYWRWSDPTPADPLNPRLLEHYRRLVLAELFFSLEDRGLRGWNHEPGNLLVRYGLPGEWSYASGVNPGEPVRISASTGYAAPSVLVRYGSDDTDLTFRFVDFALNGVFVRRPSTASSADLFLVAQPSYYETPFEDPDREQEVEVVRFVDREGNGRVELMVALPGDSWPREVIEAPERLLSRVAVYDAEWRTREETVADWAELEVDDEGRLVGVWSFEGTADSLVLGLETLDLDGEGRAALFLPVPARGPVPGEGPVLSDVAFLRGIDFTPSPDSRYLRADGDGAAYPNPGHRYFPDEGVGIAFETYGLTPGEGGDHRARLRLAVSRRSGRGLFQVLLGLDDRPPENELVFESVAPGERLEQLLTLRVPGLRPGDYVLSIQVEDLVSGLEARRTEIFQVLDPARRAEE